MAAHAFVGGFGFVRALGSGGVDDGSGAGDLMVSLGTFQGSDLVYTDLNVPVLGFGLTAAAARAYAADLIAHADALEEYQAAAGRR